MAEFVEVIKNKNRMCEAQKTCGFCPLGEEKRKRDLTCPELIKKHTELAEEIIMKWASEHHIQTNEDKFEEVFGFKPSHRCMFNNLCPECIVFGEKDCIEAWWDEEYKVPTEESK